MNFNDICSWPLPPFSKRGDYGGTFENPMGALVNLPMDVG